MNFDRNREMVMNSNEDEQYSNEEELDELLAEQTQYKKQRDITNFSDIGHLYRMLDNLTAKSYKKYYTSVEMTTYSRGYQLNATVRDRILFIAKKKGWIIEIVVPRGKKLSRLNYSDINQEVKKEIIKDIKAGNEDTNIEREHRGRIINRLSNTKFYRITDSGKRTLQLLTDIVKEFTETRG